MSSSYGCARTACVCLNIRGGGGDNTQWCHTRPRRIRGVSLVHKQQLLLLLSSQQSDGWCVCVSYHRQHASGGPPPPPTPPPHCDAPQAERMAIPCREMMDVDGRSLITWEACGRLTEPRPRWSLLERLVETTTTTTTLARDAALTDHYRAVSD